MSLPRAQRHVLGRLASGETTLLSIHLDLGGEGPAWADGPDAEGRAVYLVGAHQLRQLAGGASALEAVLQALRSGEVPPGVVAVAYAPKASVAWAEAVHGLAAEVLIDGPRGSGKTQVTPAMLLALAEVHARAGHALPLRVLWLHTSLTNARDKTVPSLQQAHWGGGWAFENDQQTAVATVGGVEMVRANFVGTRDESAQERARAEAHVVVGEEVVASLEEGGGILERVWDLARTSARLDTPRRVAIAVTNPGASDHWLYKRFIEGGGRPGTVRCPVPAEDRLTPEQARRQEEDFAGNPDLAARLGRGEWSDLRLGEVVAEGYRADVHVAPAPLRPVPGYMLGIGWDGGHSPSAVIGQLVGGQTRVYAALNALKVGVYELIEDQVIPWLVTYAPWARAQRGLLTHILDLNMKTTSEATIRESAERVIVETLRGRIVYGAVPWPPRREAVLRVLSPHHAGGQVALAISPVKETELLRQAFSSRWYYGQTPDGRVDRSRPKKPNSPWADVGDAAANLFGWLRPGSGYGEPRDVSKLPRYAVSATAADPYGGGPNRPSSARSYVHE